jgi:hypothetical protein
MRLEQRAAPDVTVGTTAFDLKSRVDACKEPPQWRRCCMSSLLTPCVSESDSHRSCRELRSVDTTTRPAEDDEARKDSKCPLSSE